jgi:hypothetical protein
MATGAEVMSMLRPNGGWAIIGDDFDSLQYDDKCQPISKSEFENGFLIYDSWKAEQDAEAERKRQATLAKLEALGLDEDDLRALGL